MIPPLIVCSMLHSTLYFKADLEASFVYRGSFHISARITLHTVPYLGAMIASELANIRSNYGQCTVSCKGLLPHPLKTLGYMLRYTVL